MADLTAVQIVRDPTLPEPELEGQASAKTGAAWRFSYRPRESAAPWSYVEATDSALDGILHRAGYRRIRPETGAAAVSEPEPE